MPVCSFCKKVYKEPRGLTVFTLDGRSIFFCSSKCRRNTKLKRDPKKTNWVKKGKHYAEFMLAEEAKKESHKENDQ